MRYEKRTAADGAGLLLYGCVLIVFCGAAIWNEGKVTINNGVCLPSMWLNVQPLSG